MKEGRKEGRGDRDLLRSPSVPCPSVPSPPPFLPTAYSFLPFNFFPSLPSFPFFLPVFVPTHVLPFLSPFLPTTPSFLYVRCSVSFRSVFVHSFFLLSFRSHPFCSFLPSFLLSLCPKPSFFPRISFLPSLIFRS